MVFNSSVFAAFFLAFYVAYLLLLRRRRLQNVLILAGSYFFYGWWDWRFLSLIVVSTLIDFMCGRLLDRRTPDDAPNGPRSYRYSPRARRALLWTSVLANLGILGFFKYCDFFAAGLSDLLQTIGMPLDIRLLNVILPVGISFYTFQTLSYTIDVYRGRLPATPSLLDFACFVAFFPQLVAGPIVRAAELLPQMARPRHLDRERVYEGAYLLLWGLFKKVVIADNLGARLVDPVFDGAIADPLGGTVLVAIYAFAIQIYCDFSGYSDMARGLAKLMGFDFQLNFNLPYFAANPSEFWRRWHISLSNWLRDYLYIPLGGNRRGPRRTYINLLLTMVLGGLWHGAAWTFVLWGIYQGALLGVHRAAMPWIDAVTARLSDRSRRVARIVAILLFFQFVCLGWLIFRADSAAQIGRLADAILSPWPWWILCGANTLAGTGLWTLVAYAAPLMLIQWAQYVTNDLNVVFRLAAPVRGGLYAGLFYALILFGADVDKPFIYFQF